MKEFALTGVTLACDGSKDHLLRNELLPFWQDKSICGGLDMSAWRQKYQEEAEVVKEYREKERDKKLDRQIQTKVAQVIRAFNRDW